jgi:hypothetical protein
MAVSSEFPLAVETMSSVLVSDPPRESVPQYVEDEEFPAHLPLAYDRILQPAVQRISRRTLAFIVVIIAILVIAASSLVAHNLAGPSASVVRSSSSR